MRGAKEWGKQPPWSDFPRSQFSKTPKAPCELLRRLGSSRRLSTTRIGWRLVGRLAANQTQTNKDRKNSSKLLHGSISHSKKKKTTKVCFTDTDHVWPLRRIRSAPAFLAGLGENLPPGVCTPNVRDFPGGLIRTVPPKEQSCSGGVGMIAPRTWGGQNLWQEFLLPADNSKHSCRHPGQAAAPAK